MTAIVRIDSSRKFSRRYIVSDQLLMDFLPDYDLGHIAMLAQPSQSKYRFHIRKHIQPDLGHLTFEAISARALEVWLAKKKQQGLSWNYRSDLRGVMSSIFTVARKWEVWRGDNPCKLVSIGRKKMVREQRKLTTAETRALLAALPDDVRMIVMVALFCTLRISEILGLRWKNVDLDGGLVRVRERYYRGDVDVTKTEGSARVIPLGELAGELHALYHAAAAPSPNDFVFSVRTVRGTTRDDRSINRGFLRPAAQRLGIYWPGFGFHCFRREAITGIAAEADVIQAMRAAGHTRIDTTLLYGLQDFCRQEAAIRKLQGSILKDSFWRAGAA